MCLVFKWLFLNTILNSKHSIQISHFSSFAVEQKDSDPALSSEVLRAGRQHPANSDSCTAGSTRNARLCEPCELCEPSARAEPLWSPSGAGLPSGTPRRGLPCRRAPVGARHTAPSPAPQLLSSSAPQLFSSSAPQPSPAAAPPHNQHPQRTPCPPSAAPQLGAPQPRGAPPPFSRPASRPQGSANRGAPRRR